MHGRSVQGVSCVPAGCEQGITAAEEGAAADGQQHDSSGDHNIGHVPSSTTTTTPNSANAFKQIPAVSANELSYEAFVSRFMSANQPVLIQSVACDWRATHEWVTHTGDVDIDAMEALFGESSVSVTTMHRDRPQAGECLDMTFAEYVAWWRDHAAKHSLGTDTAAQQLWYLKDWHFVAQHPEYQAYILPKYFQEDWLNDYLDDCNQQQQQGAQGADGSSRLHDKQPGAAVAQDSSARTRDYRFVYLGPAGTWTGLHADVFTSYSWSTNVCGTKRWLLIAPEHKHLLLGRDGHQLAPHFFCDDLAGVDANDYPNLAEAQQHIFECIQGPGDAIFVPSGWHHTVENLEDTLSINHNWFNAYNVHWVWDLLEDGHRHATTLLEDCRETCASYSEFEGLVQRNLAADSGMGFTELLGQLDFVVRRCLASLEPFHEDGLLAGQAGAATGPAQGVTAEVQELQLGGSGPESCADQCAVDTWHPLSDVREHRHDADTNGAKQRHVLFEVQQACGVLEGMAAAARRAEQQYTVWQSRRGGAGKRPGSAGLGSAQGASDHQAAVAGGTAGLQLHQGRLTEEIEHLLGLAAAALDALGGRDATSR